jgi:hypothetical protein
MAHFVCCLWNSLEQGWEIECAPGVFVVGVFENHVFIIKENKMKAVFINISWFYESISRYT